MPADVQMLTREAAPAASGAKEVLTPEDGGFAEAFSALLVREGLVDPGAVARARRASEAAFERLDVVMV